MDLRNKQIINELENINEQEKNIVKKTDDVTNNWSRLKVKKSWWYISAEVSLLIITLLLAFEIALLISDVAKKIWGTTRVADAGLYSMIFGICINFWNLAVYFILVYKGRESFTYNDVALKNNTVYKQQNNISKKNYWIGNYALVVLIINFFFFYGYVAEINTSKDLTEGYQSATAVLSVLSIIVPAATVPLAMQYVSKHSAERKTEEKYHDWMRLNAASKYAVIKKVNFDNKIDYLELSNQLGIDKNIIVIDEKSTGEAKQNITLYNNIKLRMLKNLLEAYNENVVTRADCYKNIKWKRNKAGNITLNTSFRNSSLIKKIKKINKKNDILISVMWNYYRDKFE